jgi:hypothetical protein
MVRTRGICSAHARRHLMQHTPAYGRVAKQDWAMRGTMGAPKALWLQSMSRVSAPVQVTSSSQIIAAGFAAVVAKLGEAA